MSALANMQISFKVGLPDGVFAFEMHPSTNNSGAEAAMASGSGMKLHVLTSHDFSGVTLTLFTSGGDAPANVPSDVAPTPPSAPSVPAPCNAATGSMEDIYLPDFLTSASPFAVPPYCESPCSEPSLLDGNADRPGFDDFLDTFNRDSTTTTPSDSPAAPLRDLDPPTWMTVAACTPELAPTPPRSRGRGQGRHHKFPCTMGCRMDFSRKHDRLRHEVAQHGRLCEWECSSCQGFFSSDVTFKKHRCKAVSVGRRVGDREREREQNSAV